MKAVADATAFDLCCDESAEGLTSQSLRDSSFQESPIKPCLKGEVSTDRLTERLLRFNKAFTRHSFAEVLLSLPKVPKSAFRLTGNIPLVGCESRKKVFSLRFPWGFPVVHFNAHTKMRPPSLRALY